MKKFSEILSMDRIRDLDAKDKHDVLEEMVDLMGTSDNIQDRDAFGSAIMEREEILSTGIGFGIAVPHAKVKAVKDFVMAVGRSLQGIEFESFDHEPVNIIVMIGSSDRQKDDYVRILAKVSRLLKSEENRRAILAAETAQEIFEVFTREDS